MSKQVKVAVISDIPKNSIKSFQIESMQIALVNIDGEFFALDDTCTHAQCSLANEGFFDGTAITCGCHGAQFNPKNGKVLSLPATSDLKTYKIIINKGEIFIEV